MWGLAKPVEVTGKITKIITCCFYCPPKSTRKSMLIDHMTLSLQSLLNTFPRAVISGDRNDLGLDRLLSIDPSLRLLVNVATRGPKILDVVLTNLNVFFHEPTIVPPIPVDEPSKGGVPSDHFGVVMETLNDTEIPAQRLNICRTISPINQTSIKGRHQKKKPAKVRTLSQPPRPPPPLSRFGRLSR